MDLSGLINSVRLIWVDDLIFLDHITYMYCIYIVFFHCLSLKAPVDEPSSSEREIVEGDNFQIHGGKD